MVADAEALADETSYCESPSRSMTARASSRCPAMKRNRGVSGARSSKPKKITDGITPVANIQRQLSGPMSCSR